MIIYGKQPVYYLIEKHPNKVKTVFVSKELDKKESNIAWDKISTGVGTLVFYMGIKNLESITANLIKHGRDPKTPVAVVRWASRPRQQSVVGTLEDIARIVRENDIKPPALTIVGEVVSFRNVINWYEERPLFGKRVIVTRTREQASDLVALLDENGANTYEYATIAIHPPDSWEELDKALQDISSFQWILFTSINAISAFFERLYTKGLDARALHTCKIGAVGKVTADLLLEYGLKCDLLPEKFTGEGLAEALEKIGVKGDTVLLPRAKKAREVVPERLREAGAKVVVAPVYQNVPTAENKEILKAQLLDKQVDLVTFTSSSTVTNFVQMLEVADKKELQELMEGVKVAAIGPITAKTVIENGLQIDIQPETYTILDMVDSIVNYYTADKE